MARARSPAAYAMAYDERRNIKIREFITPEGVDLKLEIASAGARFGALMIDLTLMAVILIIASIALGFAFAGTDDASSVGVIIWLLGAFLLRNFWFVAFELGPRSATPGKRMIGIRVVARNGGRLTVAAVVARNLVREAEMFLPFAFVFTANTNGSAGTAMTVLALLWTSGMSLFLLFNRDRMRLGDMIGGTWVVVARRKAMAEDLTHSWQSQDEPEFTAEELSVYGVYEVQELERVLRSRDPKTMQSVADAIRYKINRPIAEDDEVFLSAYYRQAKLRMERDLLFGKRRINKYDTAK